MKKQIFSIIFGVILIFALKNTCDAASANISCNNSATVGEKINISVTGSAVQWNLELKVNGETIAKNSEVDNVDGNKNINFSGTYTSTAEGKLDITLTGTVTEASDGSTIRSFTPKTIEVKAKEVIPDPELPTTTKSSEARLSNLGIKPDEYDFSGFSKNINKEEWSVEVPNEVSKVTIYATAKDKNAKISGTGNVTLNEGENTFKITVTAEAGNTKTYKLTIIRKTVSEEGNTSEARLSNLGIRPKDYDFSGFKRDNTSYEVEVPNDVEEVEVYAETVSSKAKVTGTGKASLKEGLNTVEVIVTAEDGKTKKTYTLNITRQENSIVDETEKQPEENTKEELGLSALLIKNINLSPKFNSKTYEYTVGVTEDLSSLEIDAKVNDSSAIVEIIGNENLQEGENIITILVSNAETGENATYQIIVNKNSIKEVTGTVDWLKPSTWGLKEKITIGVLIVLVMVIITAVVMKIKLARNEEDDLDLPGAEELDKALAEHQELAEDIIAQSQNQQEELVENEQDDDTKSDIEKAQEYFELYSKRRGKHF